MNQFKKFFFAIPFFFSPFVMANSVSLEQLTGHFNEKNDPHFIALDETVLPVNKKGMYLQKEVALKLTQAYLDFKQEYPDIPFVIVSATRNYNYQNRIWTNKWHTQFPKFKNAQKTAESILQFSSMPGTSRHHWGTDFDITSVEPNYFANDPKGQILNAWLENNMQHYGFCKPYSENRQGGYQPEAWHWSYAPLSRGYLKTYKEHLSKDPDLLLKQFDFKGYDQIQLKELVQEFVFDINPDCSE